MALYNVSISVKGLKYITENKGLMAIIWTLLDGKLTFENTIVSVRAAKPSKCQNI